MAFAHSSDKCERGTSLGKLSYEKILPRSAFTTKFWVSLYQCATECYLRKQRCKSFNYRRIYPSCQLCEEDSGQGGKNLLTEHDSIHSNIDTWKDIHVGNCSSITCTWTHRCNSFNGSGSTCVPSECPLLEISPDISIDPSNETSVGTHVWQRCELRSMKALNISTCLESTAQWFTINASCDIGYKNVQFGGCYLCIKFHDKKTTFKKAIETCQAENTKLLVVMTTHQIVNIKDAFGEQSGRVFAGITDEANEGSWAAWDGEKVNPAWNPREPNGGINENCGIINFDYNANGLTDVNCNENCSFLCHNN
ncbi:hypothetical protein CHS0354_002844 [Potamilus streckersoni]|uniref:C-type lectin domain-containing protein n=1 Tax=Potamilus streckersoni TaxID=2493646 RepID=A0AAE0VY04_9BIVA|nr:hypothetical protein CHS0354_002844 [Potamilus streckersoni]